jgi:hypothetical protein
MYVDLTTPVSSDPFSTDSIRKLGASRSSSAAVREHQRQVIREDDSLEREEVAPLRRLVERGLLAADDICAHEKKSIDRTARGW